MSDHPLTDTFTIGCIEDCHKWIIKPLGHFSDIGMAWSFFNNTILKEAWVKKYQEFYIFHDINKTKKTIPRVETISYKFPTVAEIIFNIKLNNMTYNDLMNVYQEVSLWFIGFNHAHTNHVLGVLMKEEYAPNNPAINPEIRIWVSGNKWTVKGKTIIKTVFIPGKVVNFVV